LTELQHHIIFVFNRQVPAPRVNDRTDK